MPTPETIQVFDPSRVGEGDRVIVSSRLISRTDVLVGTVTRHGARLLLGDVLLYDDTAGPNRYARIIAHEPATSATAHQR